MLLRSGLLLACIAVLLQIAVYLQPLLPEKFHIAPVCLSMTHNLLTSSSHDTHSVHHHADSDRPSLDLTVLKDYFPIIINMCMICIIINANTVRSMAILSCLQILAFKK